MALALIDGDLTANRMRRLFVKKRESSFFKSDFLFKELKLFKLYDRTKSIYIRRFFITTKASFWFKEPLYQL